MEGLKSYRKTSTVTLIVLFLLIGVGGLVRVTGSGMGCPDWPKCFGYWIPPSCECQLPDNYHEIYTDHGYPIGTNYDPVKTWIEYLNRLLGVLSGIFVIVNLYFAFKIRSTHRGIYIGALLCFILVVFEGGLGAMVVKLNLQQKSVTIHYIMAIILLCCLLYSIAAMVKIQSEEDIVLDKRYWYIIIIAMSITVLQIMSGTNLRTITETLKGITTYQWLQQNELVFNMHRLYAGLVVFGNFIFWRKFKKFGFTRQPFMVIWISILLQVITGILLNFFEFPPLAQALHILLPAILFCSQFYILSFILIKKETVVFPV